MRLTRAFTTIIIAATLALTGCGAAHSHAVTTVSSAAANPTASADIAAAKHIATQVVNTCARALGGTAQATPALTIAQPAVLGKLVHHSGRAQWESCLRSHGVPNLSQVKTCTVTSILESAAAIAKHPSLAGQALFTCVENGEKA